MEKSNEITKGLKIGIDASNIRQGGGLTHIKELLSFSQPDRFAIKKIIIWGGRETLDELQERPWLKKICPPEIDYCWLSRIFWQRYLLPKKAYDACCDILFVPGGSHSGKFRPVVTVCQNMLPFERREIMRYGLSRRALRLIILRLLQLKSFRNSDGVIFLTRYAKEQVLKKIDYIKTNETIIPHGISSRFKRIPKKQKPISHYNNNNPFRLIYVSTIDFYKHQWNVVEAVELIQEDFPVVLDLIGPAYEPALSRLKASLEKFKLASKNIFYHGNVPYEELYQYYDKADLGIFASSCENLPIVLLENMAMGLPIACSERDPMTELLGDGGVYFDPEKPKDISRAIRKLIDSPKLREDKVKTSHQIAQNFSWKHCANKTLSFLSETAKKF